MAGPITWRNINGPSPAEASRPLEAAGRSFDGALDILGRLIQQREVTADKNFQTGQDNSRNAFLDLLAGAQTPEVLAALQQSGQLDQARQGMTGATRALVRGSEEQRLTALRDLMTKGQQFDIGQRDFKEAPQAAEINALVEAGKFDEARAKLDQYNLRDETALEQALRVRQRGVVKEGYEDNAEVRAGNQDTRATRQLEDQLRTSVLNRSNIGQQMRQSSDLHKIKMDDEGEKTLREKAQDEIVAAGAQWRNHVATLQANGTKSEELPSDTDAFNNTINGLLGKYPARVLEELRQSGSSVFDSRKRAIGRDRARIDAQNAAEDFQIAQFDKNATSATGSTEPLRNLTDINATLNSTIKNEGERASVAEYVSKVSQKGIKIGGKTVYPTQTAIEAAIMQSYDGWWPNLLGGDSRGQDFEKRLEKVMREDRVLEDKEARAKMDRMRLEQALRKASEPK